jgi:hypothetical protein
MGAGVGLNRGPSVTVTGLGEQCKADYAKWKATRGRRLNLTSLEWLNLTKAQEANDYGESL